MPRCRPIKLELLELAHVRARVIDSSDALGGLGVATGPTLRFSSSLGIELGFAIRLGGSFRYEP